MGGVRTIQESDKTILEIDYSGANEDGMIALISEAAEKGLTKNERVLVLALHNNNYITPRFVQHAKSVTQPVIHLIDKMAFVGLNTTQRIILMGYSIFFQKNFKSFPTREEALNYLLNTATTDNDLPDYYKKNKN
ncbi:MAG: hypothetical protein KF803_03925 [Cyclobacteriaceae bacterium]|nr:hypothetical protein [Cyclobacteriaceae bacterium]